MATKRLGTAMLAATLALTAGSASADIGDALVGGIIGGVIVNEANKSRTKKVYRIWIFFNGCEIRRG